MWAFWGMIGPPGDLSFRYKLPELKIVLELAI
jgi:hypothetical protein